MDLFENYFQSVLNGSAQPKNPQETAISEIVIARGMLNYSEYYNRTVHFLAKKFLHLGLIGEAYQAIKSLPVEERKELSEVINKIESAQPNNLNTTIEIISKCNLRCPLCAHGGNRYYGKLNKIMPFNDFKIIWDKVKKYTKIAILVGMGESFLHPDFYRILDYISPIAIHLDTNGNTKIDHERLVRSSVNTLVFSVDGIDQRTYEKYRVGGFFPKVLDNIKATVNAKRKNGRGPTIIFKFIVFKHNEMYIEQAQKIATSLGVDSFQVNPCNLSPRVKPEYVKRFIPCGKNSISRIKSLDYGKNCTIPLNDFDPAYCYTPFQSPYIQVDGVVQPCCAAELPGYLGELNSSEDIEYFTQWNNEMSLLNTNFEDIWHKNKMVDFRLKVLKNKFSELSCKNCLMPSKSFGHLFKGTKLEPPQRAPLSDNLLSIKDIKIDDDYAIELLSHGLLSEIEYYRKSGVYKGKIGEFPAIESISIQPTI